MTILKVIIAIEESDLIIFAVDVDSGTMVNARIRKAYNLNKIKIYSIGDPGDLTYEYAI